MDVLHGAMELGISTVSACAFSTENWRRSPEEIRFQTHCAEHDVPELRRLARTIDAWRTELLAYFDTGGVSNGTTEAMNSLIKKVK